MPCACGRSIESVIQSVNIPQQKIKLNINRDKKIKVLRNFYLSRPVNKRNTRSFKKYFIGLCRRIL